MFRVLYRGGGGRWTGVPERFETYEQAEAFAFALAPDGAYLVEEEKNDERF